MGIIDDIVDMLNPLGDWMGKQLEFGNNSNFNKYLQGQGMGFLNPNSNQGTIEGALPGTNIAAGTRKNIENQTFVGDWADSLRGPGTVVGGLEDTFRGNTSDPNIPAEDMGMAALISSIFFGGSQLGGGEAGNKPDMIQRLIQNAPKGQQQTPVDLSTYMMLMQDKQQELMRLSAQLASAEGNERIQLQTAINKAQSDIAVLRMKMNQAG